MNLRTLITKLMEIDFFRDTVFGIHRICEEFFDRLPFSTSIPIRVVTLAILIVFLAFIASYLLFLFGVTRAGRYKRYTKKCISSLAATNNDFYLKYRKPRLIRNIIMRIVILIIVIVCFFYVFLLCGKVIIKNIPDILENILLTIISILLSLAVFIFIPFLLLLVVFGITMIKGKVLDFLSNRDIYIKNRPRIVSFRRRKRVDQ